jgi:hypothetical protein
VIVGVADAALTKMPFSFAGALLTKVVASI